MFPVLMTFSSRITKKAVWFVLFKRCKRGGDEAVNDSKPIEVAIIRGGRASIATVFELTRQEHQGKCHVTVYQLGWRPSVDRQVASKSMAWHLAGLL